MAAPLCSLLLTPFLIRSTAVVEVVAEKAVVEVVVAEKVDRPRAAVDMGALRPAGADELSLPPALWATTTR